MAEQRRVVVCGKSLHMAGLAASLRTEADLDVVCIDSTSPKEPQCLPALEPAVVLFDLSDRNCTLDIARLLIQPGLLLVGVNFYSNELLLLSGRCVRAVSMSDLIAAIRRQESASEPSPRRQP